VSVFLCVEWQNITLTDARKSEPEHPEYASPNSPRSFVFPLSAVRFGLVRFGTPPYPPPPLRGQWRSRGAHSGTRGGGLRLCPLAQASLCTCRVVSLPAGALLCFWLVGFLGSNAPSSLSHAHSSANRV